MSFPISATTVRRGFCHGSFPKKKPAQANEPNRDVAISTNASHPFEQLRRQFDHLFQDFNNLPSLLSSRRSGFDLDPLFSGDFVGLQSPAVDIVENEKDFEITAEVPGVDEKNLTVKVVNGNLQIKGEKRENKEDKSGSYHLTERRYGYFERTFSLPKGVDADKIQARFSKGVLTVNLPKKPEAMKPEKNINIELD
ncbi:Hsp20/alpha crystallin family protein [Pseudomonas sp. 5C2]|uniref:Hsp20/alpha crystallin family protein n=1 Tax=Pseudomonas sp. 5C2 TaxID=3048588 RepID=UPI003A10158E